MRDLKPQRAVGVNASHSEELIFNVARRLQRGTEMDRVETMYHKDIVRQMPSGNRRLTRTFEPVLNIGVQLPAIDVPDHPDSVVSNSLESVARSSFRVKRAICPKPATRMKPPRKHALPHSYLGRSSVALVRSCNSLSTSMPIAVSTGGIPTAYPHISRSTSRGGVSGFFPSATALNDDKRALSPGRNSLHSFAIAPSAIISLEEGCCHSTKGQPRRTWVTKPGFNRTENTRAAREIDWHFAMGRKSPQEPNYA